MNPKRFIEDPTDPRKDRNVKGWAAMEGESFESEGSLLFLLLHKTEDNFFNDGIVSNRFEAKL